MMNFKKIYFGLTVILMTGCSVAVEDVSVPETTSSSVNSEIPALPDGAYLLSGVTVTEITRWSLLTFRCNCH